MSSREFFYRYIRVGHSPKGLPASRFRDKWQIWDGKRKTCFSPSRIVTFLHVQIFLYRRGQNVTFFGKDVTKNVTSWKKYFRVRKRHILPRNVTNVTHHIFCHRKKWQMWCHSPKSETGNWEEIRVRPTLSQVKYELVVWHFWLCHMRTQAGSIEMPI